MDRLERDAQKLEVRFGKSFRIDYGWAASALGKKVSTFADVEAGVALDHYRPFFKLASNTMHAGSKGTLFRLGLLNTEPDLLLAGASNVGLEEAGRLTALSLSQVSVCLFLISKGNVDGVVWSQVLLNLSTQVEAQFIKAKRRIEREERDSQDESEA